MDTRQLMALASLVLMIIGLPLFFLGWLHGWRMFMSRTGDWRGYILPRGMLIDATLTEEGRRHRRKCFLYNLLAAPFLIGMVVLMAILELNIK